MIVSQDEIWQKDLHLCAVLAWYKQRNERRANPSLSTMPVTLNREQNRLAACLRIRIGKQALCARERLLQTETETQ